MEAPRKVSQALHTAHRYTECSHKIWWGDSGPKIRVVVGTQGAFKEVLLM